MNSSLYSIESTYYFTSYLCKVIVNIAGFNVVSTNSNSAHAYEHLCSPNDGSNNL